VAVSAVEVGDEHEESGCRPLTRTMGDRPHWLRGARVASAADVLTVVLLSLYPLLPGTSTPPEPAYGALLGGAALLGATSLLIPWHRLYRRQGFTGTTFQAYSLVWHLATVALISAGVAITGGESSFLYPVYFVLLVVVALGSTTAPSLRAVEVAASPLGFLGAALAGSAHLEVGTCAFQVSVLVLVALATNLLGGELKVAKERADATRRHEADRARRDPLTGCLNRAGFLEAVEEARATGRLGLLAYLDLDGLKVLNDTLGHEAGDALLREVGHRLDTGLGPGVTSARLGGDEFALCTTAGSLGPARLGQLVLECFKAPFVVDGRCQEISASVGVLDATTGLSIAQLVARGDEAMYEAKRAGRNRVVVYDAALIAHKSTEAELATELPSLLDDGALRCRYRTVVEVSSGRIVALRAEAALDHRIHGRLDGPLLSRLAARVGCTGALERALLGAVTADLARWRATIPAAGDLVVAAPMTPRSAPGAEVASEVAEVLEAAGLAPGALVVAIAEPDSPGALVRAQELAGALDSAGIKLGLVGYGRGAASLKVFSSLPVRLVELDASLADTTAAMHQALLGSIAELARRLDLVLVVPQPDAGAPASPGALDTLGVGYVTEGRAQGPLDAAEVAARLALPSPRARASAPRHLREGTEPD